MMAGTGDWIGTYGAQGVHIPRLDSASPIDFTATLPNGAPAPTWQWSADTTDPRGLQKPDGTGRISSCLFTGNAASMDLTFTLSGPRRLTFYLCDWDTNTRVQSMEVLALNGDQIKLPITFDSFRGGFYWSVDVPGSCVVRVKKLGGINAIVNGIFVDPPPGPPPDTTSPAMLQTILGTDGRTLILSATEPIVGHEGFSLVAELPAPIEFVPGSGTEPTVRLFRVTRERPIYQGELVRLNYTPGDVTDGAGNPLAPLIGASVDNLSEVPGPTWKVTLGAATVWDDATGIESGTYIRQRVWPE